MIVLLLVSLVRKDNDIKMAPNLEGRVAHLCRLIQQKTDLEKIELEHKDEIERHIEKKEESNANVKSNEEKVKTMESKIQDLSSKKQEVEVDIEHGKQEEAKFIAKINLLELKVQDFKYQLYQIKDDYNSAYEEYKDIQIKILSCLQTDVQFTNSLIDDAQKLADGSKNLIKKRRFQGSNL